MATYSLNVLIDDAELTALKTGGYSLCVAKNVNGQFNVVWKGIQFVFLTSSPKKLPLILP